MKGRWLACALALAGCRTVLLDEDGGAADDSGTVRDMAMAADLTCQPAPPVDAGACPCGMSGLCRAATGRLSVQTESVAGALRIEVMDDNGCNRAVVATDAPVGVPRWAADRQRLAYLTSAGSGAQLHVIRVNGSGQVVCRDEVFLGFGSTEVAWASDSEVWLFEPQRSGQGGKLVRWQLGMGALDQIPIDAERFDAIGDGPLLSVRSCGNLCTILETRPLVAGGTLATLVSSKGVIGPVRIAPSGTRGVYEEGGSNLIDLAGGAVQTVGVEGDRSPAFALPGEQAIVYTTDDGQLDYHFISGPQAGQDAAIPPGWKNVFSPDWAATPDSCGPTSCF